MIVPIIFHDETVDEVSVPRRFQYYEHPRLADTKFLKMVEGLGRHADRVLATRELCRLEEFYYRLDTKRLVRIFVYVSEGFGLEYREGARMGFVEAWVEKRIAWFASYGERVERD